MIKAIDMLHVDKYINIFGMLHFFWLHWIVFLSSYECRIYQRMLGWKSKRFLSSFTIEVNHCTLAS